MTPARPRISTISTTFLWLFLIIAGCLSAFWWYERPLVGDDLFYALDLRQRGGQLYHLPGQMAAVWFGTNGRAGDMLNTIWLEMLPKWFTAIISFVATIILPITTIKLSGIKIKAQPVATAILVGATVWLLPWWDMSHLVCIINYPWGANLAAVCLALMLKCRMHGNWWLLGVPFAFCAGAYHEALGAPLAVGLSAWLIYNRIWHKLTTPRKVWIVSMIAGGFFTLTSPSLWDRVATETDTESYSPFFLLVTSANLAILLVIILAVVAISNKRLFKKLAKDICLIFSIAAVGSAAIVAVGGTIGRAGFFAQLFAIIAFSRIYVITNPQCKLNHILAYLISCTIYCGATATAFSYYNHESKNTKVLQEAYDTYFADPEHAMSLVLEIDGYEQWDASSLKALDPRYDRFKDRNDSPKLSVDSQCD